MTAPAACRPHRDHDPRDGCDQTETDEDERLPAAPPPSLPSADRSQLSIHPSHDA